MLSKKTKYAINALVYLAKNKDEGPILISTIAEHENIPKKFLETILLDLKNAGYLNSKKGKGGGYYFIKEASEVNLAEIVRYFDGAIGLLPCVTHKYYEKCEECLDEKTCGIRHAFLAIRNATVEMLKENTIEKMINKEEKLKTDD
ncbi:MAG: Rrf2 family transcriptional regulator [Chitinophagales bacterium]|nr:Rrf2 family transcriptional regulator [Chitinophagales bacterium]